MGEEDGRREFEAKITPVVIVSCIMAASGGLMFGYDVGISGELLLDVFFILFGLVLMVDGVDFCYRWSDVHG